MNINFHSILNTRLFSLNILICFLSFYVHLHGNSQELILKNRSIKEINGKAEITGIVVDSEENPIKGATITFIDSTGGPHSTITNDNGSFRFFLNKELLMQKIELRLELQGYTSSIIKFDADLPVAPWPPIVDRCETQEIILKSGDGIIFETAEIAKKDDSDIFFEDDKFFCSKSKGRIAAAGDQGNKSLCDINYPLWGYCDSIIIKLNHVYLYESAGSSFRAEIRVKLFKKSIEVIVSYHVRKG